MRLEELVMTLKRYKLGGLIEQLDNRNSDNKYNVNNVRGISTNKCFIEIKANMDGVSLTSYKIVNQNEFAYVSDTSRRGDKIAVSFNKESSILVSSIYTVFRVVRDDLLLADYLFIYFNRPEFDRFSRFNSWGSARETFNWDDFCDIEIELPSIEIQQKYVNIYNSMLQNQQCYEKGLDDLNLTCVALIEQLKSTIDSQSIIPYLTERCERNINNKYNELIGVGNEGFILPRGTREESTFHKCNIFYPKDFVYNPSVIAKGAIAYNSKFLEPKICTEEYIVFYVNDETILLPEFLFIWMKRSETGRYLEYLNIDSVRNRVYFRDLSCIKIPIPSIDVQKNISDLYNAYYLRKEINEKLKSQIKSICPILIKGSLDEARKLKEA